MKAIFSSFIFALLLSSCSCSKENSSATAEVIAEEPTKTENGKLNPAEVKLLKEKIFFYIRERLADLDQNTFFKSESFEIESDRIIYSAVIIDTDMLEEIALFNPWAASVTLTGGRYKYTNEEIGDSIVFIGTYKIIEAQRNEIEGAVTSVNIRLDGESTNYYQTADAYSYEMKRVMDGYDVEEDLIVKLNEPIIYTRQNLYLKARIQLLTESDLKGMSSEELTYFRNEIFARHGHNFKTDKMKEYFLKQNWYRSYFDDATFLLNEIEKKNALFIQSLES